MAQTIHVLSEELANQVAAGEVVTGPASALKELMENAIDAGATRVHVECAAGGKSVLRVTDNGAGISKDDLPLALSRHATSKISSINDLESVLSMGFRGEALASIASVSRFSIVSRTSDSDVAWKITAHGAVSTDWASEPFSKPLPVGTVVEVRDLFFRVPGRQKFLGSTQRELRRMRDAFKRVAMAHQDVAMRLEHEGKTLYDVPANTQSDPLARFKALLGDGFCEGATLFKVEHPICTFWGVCAKPLFHRAQSDMQFLFVNKRPIRDRGLSFALKRAYQDFMPPGRQAAYCVFIDMDPVLVDANVHPSKEEVRFADPESLQKALKQVVHACLREQKPMHYAKPVASNACQPSPLVRAASSAAVAWPVPETQPAGISSCPAQSNAAANVASATLSQAEASGVATSIHHEQPKSMHNNHSQVACSETNALLTNGRTVAALRAQSSTVSPTDESFNAQSQEANAYSHASHMDAATDGAETLSARAHQAITTSVPASDVLPTDALTSSDGSQMPLDKEYSPLIEGASAPLASQLSHSDERTTADHKHGYASGKAEDMQQKLGDTSYDTTSHRAYQTNHVQRVDANQGISVFNHEQPPSLTQQRLSSDQSLHLGQALCQLHGIYILAQHAEGLLIVDMHAAHERILYEKLKKAYAKQGVPMQRRLVPLCFQATEDMLCVAKEQALVLQQLGVMLELDETKSAISVVATPALLQEKDPKTLVESLLAEFLEYGDMGHVQTKLHQLFATMACHQAIRANRLLNVAEMNALLRDIEKTQSSDYCNHGRPTWFVWKYEKIDSLFRRGQ